MPSIPSQLARVLIGWLLITSLGALLYWDASREAAHNSFPPGLSLPVLLVLLTYSVSSPISGRTLRQWLRIIVLIAGWFFFFDRVEFTLNMLAKSPTADLLRQYETRSLEFLSYLFLWIVALPDEEPPIPASQRLRLFCKVTLAVIGLVIGSFATYQALHALHGPGASPWTQFQIIQAWLVRAACFLYAFLVLWKFLPRTVTRWQVSRPRAGGPR